MTEQRGTVTASPIPDGVMAAVRDASSIPRPNTRTRKKIHVAVSVSPVGGGELWGEAACDPAGMPLDMGTSWSVADVPAHARCRRRGCASRWPNP